MREHAVSRDATIVSMSHVSGPRPAGSRRSFLTALACFPLLAQKSRTLASAVFQYSDPATEFPVFRLTSPSYTSRLPAHYGRALARRSNFLLYASDVNGRMDAYRMDLKTGISHQLTDVEALDPSSLTFVADEREVCCMAGGRLLLVNVGNSRVREIYRVPDGFTPGMSISVSEDGLYSAVTEKQGERYRLRLIHMASGMATTLVEAAEEIGGPIARPRRASVLYRRGGGLWLANYDGQQNYRLRLADGETGPATWSPDGRSIFYLNYPADPHRLHNIREFTPDSNQDVAIADTTQFVAFERNGDASVFAGASGSKASPYVLLLIRAVKRELTLCQHRASDPAMVSPVFSPNSQRLFFVSDQHGKPAIYSMQVEKLVEETDSGQ
jgi:oligogalacturonide lyase